MPGKADDGMKIDINRTVSFYKTDKKKYSQHNHLYL